MVSDTNHLQVRLYGEKLVGWLTNTDANAIRSPFLALQSYDSLNDQIEERQLPIYMLAQDKAVTRRVNSPEHDAPAYAMSKAFTDEYVWPCLKVSLDEYEWVFDLPDFLPYDEGPDDPESNEPHSATTQLTVADLAKASAALKLKETELRKAMGLSDPERVTTSARSSYQFALRRAEKEVEARAQFLSTQDLFHYGVGILQPRSVVRIRSTS